MNIYSWDKPSPSHTLSVRVSFHTFLVSVSSQLDQNMHLLPFLSMLKFIASKPISHESNMQELSLRFANIFWCYLLCSQPQLLSECWCVCICVCTGRGGPHCISMSPHMQSQSRTPFQARVLHIFVIWGYNDRSQR